ncbi:MAG TPA: PAS domain-containing protein [Streptosporangiaceae bacterium]|nr:PAS domain-containing protein [Streptosporangiaceae bacterium]
MTMPDINYQAVFLAFPGPTALLSCDFTILDANDDYLAAVGRQRTDVVGQNIFVAFPTNSSEPGNSGADNLRASLESVVATGEMDRMELIRYDIEVPGRPGVFDERYWAVVNSPVMGPGGRPDVIVHRAADATATVRQVIQSQAVS